MKTVATLFLLGVAATGCAQITYTTADGLLGIGDTVTYNLTTWTTPGPAGAAVTWDFSWLSLTGTSSDVIVDPSSTTWGTNYPDAEIAQGTLLGYGYFDQMANALRSHGSANALTTVWLPDTWLMRQYPFTYGDSWSDDFSGAGMTGGNSLIWSNGSCADTVDGWGTLITPGATYPDVLRLKSIATYNEIISGQQFPHYWETYEWFTPGIKKPLLFFHKNTNLSTMSTETFSGWLDTVIVSTDIPQHLGEGSHALELSPNPAFDRITVSIDDQNMYGMVSLVDATGRTVLRRSVNSTTIRLDVAHLKPGTYFVKLSDGKEIMHGRFIKQ